MSTQEDAALLIQQDDAVVTLVINDAPRHRMSLAFMEKRKPVFNQS